MAKKEKSQAAEKVAKAEKASKVKKSNSKGNIFIRISVALAKFFKDFKGELKKIVWPDKKTVIKSTGVVLSVVVVIGIIIFLIDTGLTEVIKLLSNAAKDFASGTTAAVTEAAAEVQTTIAAATQDVATTLAEAVTTAVTGG